MKINDSEHINLVSGNYSIALWQAGKKQEAITLTEKQVQKNIAEKNYSNAQLLANNVGFMFFINEDYGNARSMFKIAVDITEQYRKDLPPDQQLAVMNEHSSAYSGLIMCCQKLNDPKMLFEAQDLNRSRLLREKINPSIKTVTLEATQQLLKPNEILLYYSLAGPGEMVVNAITQNGTTIAYSFPINDWLALKKKYTNRINKVPSTINGYISRLDEDIIDGKIVRYATKEQAFHTKDFETAVTITRDFLYKTPPGLENIQNEFLRHWYDFLIKPVESSLVGKKTIIISGENVLNYLPFETFINPSGQYLIENYNVKYIPSATVWATLKNRNYSPSQKSLLAMGGATYAPPSQQGGTVRSMPDMYDLQNRITEKVNANNSNLTPELKALGFGGANYLKGTLIEVQNLGKIIPDATILTANQMKESDIKKLNSSGELAKYKYVHIATHGFALDNIPELSGVMMTQPPTGDGNEDMFLLAYEIGALQLNADLAVLSACETALGKIYGGEGINGLNSALLTAGANNTLLSLWPVSDAGTMIFMSEVYARIHLQKMSVEDAVNSTKRDMLKGEYGETFAKPDIWAPFLHYGQ